MIDELAGRRLDVDLLARELGNWRTSSASGPAYQGLADGLRMLIVDGRLPVGAQLPSERALADALRVSRTTVTAAYTQMRDDGYLNGRRGARSTTALPRTPRRARRPENRPSVNLAAATLAAPAAAVSQAFAEAAHEVIPYLHGIGVELTGVPAAARRHRRKILRARTSHRSRRNHGHHGRAPRDRSDPGHLHPARRPGAGRTAHLPRRPRRRWPPRGIRPVPVAMTDEGWELDAVDAAVRQLSPSLAYLIPDNHNPTGMTMPPAQRKRLAQIIAETRTRTIIDETITDMWLDEPVPAPLAAAMTSRRDLVLTVGSMSKSCWGGLRIGWIRAERSTLATIAALRPAVDMGTRDPRTTRCRKASRHRDEFLPERRDILRARRALLLDAARRTPARLAAECPARAGCRCGCGCPHP